MTYTSIVIDYSIRCLLLSNGSFRVGLIQEMKEEDAWSLLQYLRRRKKRREVSACLARESANGVQRDLPAQKEKQREVLESHSRATPKSTTRHLLAYKLYV